MLNISPAPMEIAIHAAKLKYGSENNQRKENELEQDFFHGSIYLRLLWQLT